MRLEVGLHMHDAVARGISTAEQYQRLCFVQEAFPAFLEQKHVLG